MSNTAATEAIQSPLTVIARLFEQHVQDKEPSTFDPSDHFANLFATTDQRSQIPAINSVSVQRVPKNTLVRFRCMVQDTGLGPEMFVSAYKSNSGTELKCYRYTDDPIDSDAAIFDESSNYLCERFPVYCVSPPGETDWVKDRLYPTELSTSFDGLSIENLESKKDDKKFPLPETEHSAAIVKFYQSAEALRVGQLVDVIGVMGAVQPEDTEVDQFNPGMSSLSGVPVIHAITYQSLEGSAGVPFGSEDLDNMLHQARDIRAKLIDYIAAVFGGDKLVAEFVLLQLISRVTAKHQDVKIGQFTLNVSNFPDVAQNGKSSSYYALKNTASKLVASMIERLALQIVSLPLTIEGLNAGRFSPKSEYENLQAGLLQLVDGTSLLIDETSLTEGTLNDTGVRNVQALNNVIQNQSLKYDFPYSQFDFDTDISIISLSSGKSILPNHCSVRLEPIYNLAEIDEPLPNLPAETMNIFRMYLQAAKHSAYDIPAEVSEYIQSNFVNERKSASESGKTLPTQEDLMLRVNLARLVSLSFGEKTLKKESYDYAKSLDESRKSRLHGSEKQKDAK
ncbi:hypothetical protein VTP01DRAFT_7679 [Rhizomucor pusillus]|uniref:uncharacterized protein n=1 Tax=Rhizomucor pusillus TaxID=4840 RepID=UPI003743A031